MKQKITIGLLVFFMGILVTACGKKKNNNNNSDNKGDCQYNSFRELKHCNGRNSVSLSGSFYIESSDQYARVFIGEIGESPTTVHTGTQFDINDPNLGNQIANVIFNNAFGAVIHCGSAKIGADLLQDMGYDEVRLRCSIINSNRESYDSLRSRYNSTLQFEFDDNIGGNGIRSVILSIERDGYRDTIEFNYRENDYTFYGRSRYGEDLLLEIMGDRIHLVSRSSGRIGYFVER